VICEETRIVLGKEMRMSRATTVLGNGWKAFPRARAVRLFGTLALAIGLILVSRFLAETVFAGEVFREVDLGTTVAVVAFFVTYCGIGRWVPSRSVRLFALAVIVVIATQSLAEVFRVWPPSGAIWFFLGWTVLFGLFGLAASSPQEVPLRWAMPVVRAVFSLLVLANYWSAGQWPSDKLQNMVPFGLALLIGDALRAGAAEDWDMAVANVAPIYLDLVLLLVYFAV